MARNRKGMNKHQKAAFRPGEHRVRADEVEYYLELSRSTDPDERLEAADNLCPCHVRTANDEVQQAVFRMMEDSDVRVRRAAWHTLEDGGCPTSPVLDRIFEQAVEGETDRKVRRFVEEFAVPWLQEKQQVELLRAQRSIFTERGKCDFCGATNVPVKPDYDTEIGAGRSDHRLARICESCA